MSSGGDCGSVLCSKILNIIIFILIDIPADVVATVWLVIGYLLYKICNVLSYLFWKVRQAFYRTVVTSWIHRALMFAVVSIPFRLVASVVYCLLKLIKGLMYVFQCKSVAESMVEIFECCGVEVFLDCFPFASDHQVCCSGWNQECKPTTVHDIEMGLFCRSCLYHANVHVEERAEECACKRCVDDRLGRRYEPTFCTRMMESCHRILTCRCCSNQADQADVNVSRIPPTAAPVLSPNLLHIDIPARPAKPSPVASGRSHKRHSGKEEGKHERKHRKHRHRRNRETPVSMV